MKSVFSFQCSVFSSAMLICLLAVGCTDKPDAVKSGVKTDSAAKTESDIKTSGKTAGDLKTNAEKTAQTKTASAKTEVAKTVSKPAVKPSPAVVEPLNYIAPPLTDEEITAGWISLFDGSTLYGWTPNSDTKWEVADGVIVGSGETPGLLVSNVQLLDYELRCDFKLEADGNSGVFLRSAFSPKDPAVDCYELNICDSHEAYPTGTLVKRKKLETQHKVEGDWHTFHVTVQGNSIKANLDGQPILDFTDESETPSSYGHIGLQMNGGQIEFRKVVLRPLSTTELINGKDLAGWQPVPGSVGEFPVTNGVLDVKGGACFLETENTYGDFVLQLDARTNAEDVNSGVFFRAIKGTEEAPSNGYELQIHNGFADRDRTKPNDYKTGFGTGAIFRRQKVRRVMSDDHKWLSMTLIANGPHFASWVNGYQVTDFTDERKPDPNPRRGLRLDAGHLSLQGHDPGSDVSFRSFRITEITVQQPE